MRLTSFTRSFWKTVVECKATDELILKHYDIIKDRESGMSVGQLAIKYQMSSRNIFKILEKYR